MKKLTVILSLMASFSFLCGQNQNDDERKKDSIEFLILDDFMNYLYCIECNEFELDVLLENVNNVNLLKNFKSILQGEKFLDTTEIQEEYYHLKVINVFVTADTLGYFEPSDANGQLIVELRSIIVGNNPKIDNFAIPNNYWGNNFNESPIVQEELKEYISWLSKNQK